MKYDIPVIVSVESKDIEEARRIVYQSVESYNDGGAFDPQSIGDLKYPDDVSMNMADDSNTTRTHQRVVFLHPTDTHNTYSQEEYNAKLNEKEEE
jgi:hypothetical protein